MPVPKNCGAVGALEGAGVNELRGGPGTGDEMRGGPGTGDEMRGGPGTGEEMRGSLCACGETDRAAGAIEAAAGAIDG